MGAPAAERNPTAAGAARAWSPATSLPPLATVRPRSQAGPPARFEDPRVLVVRDPAELARHVAAWAALAAAALEPNVFYEPWFLLPALRAFAGHADLRCVLVFGQDRAKRHESHRLIGLFPLERRATTRGLPIARLRFWQSDYTFLCAPLLHRDGARECLAAFSGWLRSGSAGASLLELQNLPGDGPLAHLLIEQFRVERLAAQPAAAHTRALFRPSKSAEQFLAAALSGKHRKELRRKTYRLAERGAISFDEFRPGGEGNLPHWIREFLTLEANGWKGRTGSALAATPHGQAFFTSLVEAAAAERRLMLLALRLDGVAIAMKCNFLTADGSGGFAFKIAFDEAYAEYSPGVLLEVEHVRRLHAMPSLEWMDSCAAADHPMISRLWPARRAIQTTLAPTRPGLPDLLVSTLPLARWARRNLRVSGSLAPHG